MFTDIFSSFDPCLSSFSSSSPIQPFWLLNYLILIPILPTFWTAPSQAFWLTTIPLNTVWQQLSRSSRRLLPGWNTSVATLFLSLIVLNLIGLTPYVFRTTSHLIFTLSFGLILWLRLILSSLINKPLKFLANLLPGGAPLWLNPFLVLIETTSISARPATLSFRLAANISAGHIVLSLIRIFSAKAIFSSLPLFLLLLSALTGYFLFEVGICLIQAFIFCLLLSLYSNEHTWADCLTTL